jgi:hypothetical protein
MVLNTPEAKQSTPIGDMVITGWKEGTTINGMDVSFCSGGAIYLVHC